MTPIRPSRLLTSRIGIVAAATIGFAVGAVGFAAAQPDDASPAVVATPATTDDGPTTSVDDGPTVTSATTLDDGPVTTNDDDGPTISADDDGPVTSVDDGPTVTSGTTVTTVDDGPVTSVDDGPTVTSGTTVTTVDDGPVTSVDDGPTVTSGTTVTTVDDGPVTTIDDGPTTSVASALPEPFTTSYSSSGGSIGVTWSGTAFTLNSVTPAAGFRAEIEHQSWDRVRVDFEGADDDARIEVRINDGRLQFRVD